MKSEEPWSLSCRGPVPVSCLPDPLSGLQLGITSLLGTLTQIEPTLHYPPVEPMPGVTTGILACASSACRTCLMQTSMPVGAQANCWGQG